MRDVNLVQYGQSVIWHRYAGTTRNAHNMPVDSWNDEPLDNIGVDVPDTSEPRDGASNRQIVDLVLFLPPGTTVGPRDQFTIGADKYQVEGGGPPVVNFLAGVQFHTEVKVRRVTG